MAAFSVLLFSLVTAAPAEALVAPVEITDRMHPAPIRRDRSAGQHSVGARGVPETIRRADPRVTSTIGSGGGGLRTADTFVNDPSWSVQWPFPVGVPISARFGARKAPAAGASSNHMGVDFTPGAGVPIHIVADGVVQKVTANDNSCGVHVMVGHVVRGQLISSVYCHMQQGSVRVAVGQHVRVGEVVGVVGNTGISTGAHLHFEIRLGGTKAVDPLAWLAANAG